MKINKKAAKILPLILLLFLIPKKLFGVKKFDFSKFKKSSRDKLEVLQDSLINAGLSGISLKLALAQLLYETGEFTSRSQVAALNNNYSGIKYICNSRQKATKGSPVPARERSSNPNACSNFYAKFANADAWAVDFVRILSLVRGQNNLGKPIEADSLEEYNNRLYLNGYYERTPSSKQSYLRGLTVYFNKII